MTLKIHCTICLALVLASHPARPDIDEALLELSGEQERKSGSRKLARRKRSTKDGTSLVRVEGSASRKQTSATSVTDWMWHSRQTWHQFFLQPSIILSGIAWSLFLGLVWALPSMSWEMKQQGADRIMSTANALIGTAFGLAAEFMLKPSCEMPNEHWLRYPILILLGYLLTDLVSMMVCDVWHSWRDVDLPMITHHVFVVLFFSISYTWSFGMYFAATLLITEASTPFVNMFWYLTYTKRKHTNPDLFRATGLALLTTFFLCRMVFIPISFYQASSLSFCIRPGLGSSRRHVFGVEGGRIMIAAYIFMYLLNCFWFKKLVAGALKAKRAAAARAAGTAEEEEEETPSITEEGQEETEAATAPPGREEQDAGSREPGKEGEGGTRDAEFQEGETGAAASRSDEDRPGSGGETGGTSEFEKPYFQGT